MSDFSSLRATMQTPSKIEPVSAPIPAVQPSEGNRILLVDDNQDAVDTLAVILELNGFTVKVETDPIDAIRNAREFQPTVAVLDIGLPGMDGYELARRLLAADGLAACRLIALSGYGTPEDREKSRQAGFHEHLLKPVDLDLFVATITQQCMKAMQAR